MSRRWVTAVVAAVAILLVISLIHPYRARTNASVFHHETDLLKGADIGQ